MPKKKRKTGLVSILNTKIGTDQNMSQNVALRSEKRPSTGSCHLLFDEIHTALYLFLDHTVSDINIF